MGAPGTKPTMDRSQVRRTNADVIEWQDFDEVPNLKALNLPPRSIAEGPDAPVGALDRWPDATQRWWRAVSRLPHTVSWDAAMWETAFSVAELHARFVEGWKGHGGAEWRIARKILGTTPDDRRDLRIRYVPRGTMKGREQEQRRKTASGSGATVSRLDEYRDL